MENSTIKSLKSLKQKCSFLRKGNWTQSAINLNCFYIKSLSIWKNIFKGKKKDCWMESFEKIMKVLLVIEFLGALSVEIVPVSAYKWLDLDCCCNYFSNCWRVSWFWLILTKLERNHQWSQKQNSFLTSNCPFSFLQHLTPHLSQLNHCQYSKYKTQTNTIILQSSKFKCHSPFITASP